MVTLFQSFIVAADVHACLAEYYGIKAVWELELSVLEKCVILFFAQVNGLSLLAVIYAYSYSLVLMGVIIWTVLESFRILLFKQLQRGFNKLKQEKAGRQETDRQERGRFHLNYIHQVSAFRQDYIKAVVRVARCNSFMGKVFIALMVVNFPASLLLLTTLISRPLATPVWVTVAAKFLNLKIF
ncbi:hypothetical protein TYRP_011669 [Tyrophagus putrescentiae]|nr:hypothetical protein TYRP_011669 [Tyrophagus putrescentiae]